MKVLCPSYAPPNKWRNEAQANFLKGIEWKRLRQSVLERDDFTCSYCGYRSKKYQVVDHIDGDPENNSNNNFQTICQSCNLIKHSGQGCCMTGIVDLYRYSKFNQNAVVIITRTMRDIGKSDDEIISFLGLQDKVPFKMDWEYLESVFAFVSSRSSAKGDEMYDKWKVYHESFLKKQPREEYVKNKLKYISEMEYRVIEDKAKEKLFNYIPELADFGKSSITSLLIDVEILKIARTERSKVLAK